MDSMYICSEQQIPQSTLDDIQAIVSNHHTLENILNWGLSQSSPKVFEDMIAQDEFSIDVIIAYDSKFYLAYDVT